MKHSGEYETLASRQLEESTGDAPSKTVPHDYSDAAPSADHSLRSGQGAGTHTLASTAFWGFLTTQFLGAFNDNYFKQMVLLTCASNVAIVAGRRSTEPDRQSLAMAAFALPFVLMSGLGGYLSDRVAKQRVDQLSSCFIGGVARCLSREVQSRQLQTAQEQEEYHRHHDCKLNGR